MKKKEYKKSQLNKATTLSLAMIVIALAGFMFILFQFLLLNEIPSTFGVLGDALGGILNPIIGIAASVLTFLAFYMQIIANEELKNQFNKTQEDQHNDFIFNNHRKRLNLFISEFNNFNISYHNNMMIRNINDLRQTSAKKYNFVGLQAIQLFLIEFFRDKKEKEVLGNKNPQLNDSYLGIYLTITNMIIDYNTVFKLINKSSLKEEYLDDLQSLMKYIYFSKLVYIIEILLRESLSKALEEEIRHIYDYYKND